MKVTIDDHRCEEISVRHMEPGQWGVTHDGTLWFRTMSTAACIQSPGSSYTIADRCETLVRILHPHTKITIEV